MHVLANVPSVDDEEWSYGLRRRYRVTSRVKPVVTITRLHNARRIIENEQCPYLLISVGLDFFPINVWEIVWK